MLSSQLRDVKRVATKLKHVMLPGDSVKELRDCEFTLLLLHSHIVTVVVSVFRLFTLDRIKNLC